VTAVTEFLLPDVGEGLQEAEIVTWHVAPGDRVAEDQVLVEVETDKSVVEIPSPHDGVVVRLGGDAGDVLKIGAVLVELARDGEPGSDANAPAASPPSEPAQLAVDPALAADPAADPLNGTRRRVLASPSTRRLAVERGVDLATVAGSGPAGRVTAADVEAAAAHTFADDRADESGGIVRAGGEWAVRIVGQGAEVGEWREPLRGLRRRIVQTMTETLKIPAIAEWRDVDASELLAVHARLRARAEHRGMRLTLLPLVLAAVIAALRDHPRFNARLDLDREEIVYRSRIDLGVATATPQGLVVPVIRDAGARSITELAAELARLAAAARDRTLTPDETGPGTFTVSNYGSFGTRHGVPLIRPPEVGIVGVGRVHDAVVAVDGQPAVRPILPLAVSTDHRLNDGDHLAAFAAAVGAYLADPALLLVS
jgi:pyruvate dehydrogenase E2 component (dihydrolipoamide acetyltransferase)